MGQLIEEKKKKNRASGGEKKGVESRGMSRERESFKDIEIF